MACFNALQQELDRWTADERIINFWWRDDDAKQPTPALDRLLQLGDAYSVPLGLAVVPAKLDPALTGVVGGRAVEVLQHGYAHVNHAAPGERAIECGGIRDLTRLFAEFETGKRQLESAFGKQFLAVMVPPWNRIDAGVRSQLSAAGYRAVSVFGSRQTSSGTEDGFVELNAHLDILTWKGGARFAGHEKIVDLTVSRLAERRLAAGSTTEPFGLLTHHLDHDQLSWDFLDAFLAVLCTHSAVRWCLPSALIEMRGNPCVGEQPQ